MTAHRIPAAAVVLAGEHLAAAAEAVRIARAARARHGLPDARAWAELAVLLAPEPRPQRDEAEPTSAHHDVMTTRQAADVLGLSARQVRRIAPGLGGRLVAGRLILDADAVTQHHEGMDK